MRSLQPLTLVACLLVGGCASGQITGQREHILLSDARGRPLDPEVPPRKRERMQNEYQVQLNSLFSSMKDYFDEQPQRTPRVTIFIHGGLNNRKSTVRRAESLHEVIEAEGAYPIFVNWDSSLWNSLGHHYFFVRNGRWRPGVARWTSGIVFFADFVRALGRIPVTTYQQGVDHVGRNWKMKFNESKTPWNEHYCALRRDYEAQNENAIAISGQEKLDTPMEGFRATLSFVLKIPFKFLTAPFLDALAPAAWNVMERRTTLLFEDEEIYREKPVEDARPMRGANGSLAVFLGRLQEKIENDWCKPVSGGPNIDRARPLAGRPSQSGRACPEITLIGHSMGAIVLNKILERYPDLPIRNIVYMAAADSIANYQNATWDYLRRPGNENAEVYHLLLDDFSEMREAYLWDLAPRGSLLVWIDEFLTDPETPWDRTAGRVSNLAPHLPDTPADLRDRIKVKIFGSGKKSEGKGPLGHGDFDGGFDKKEDSWTGPLRFWQEGSWQPNGPGKGLRPHCDRRCVKKSELCQEESWQAPTW